MPDTDPLVRPFGYVSPDPVVRHVRDGLFLGNVHAADPESAGREFDHVVSATTEPQPGTTHHHPLTDGPGNDWCRFANAVEAVRRCHRAAGDLLVHCEAGVSRSATLAATALAAEEGRSFRAALDDVHAARPLAMPHPALHELAVVYLAARD